GGNIKIISSGDGIDAVEDAGNSGVISISNGSIEIMSGGDALQAENEVLITEGTFKLVSGGGSLSTISSDLSAKGVKGVASVRINSGNFLIDSADDAIHSNGNIIINGGKLILMTRDDAVHADGSIEVNGGNISITKSFEGLEGASVTINDGIINIISGDDGIDALGSLAIKNGEINIKSVGDALQAEKDVLITGGTFNIFSGGGCLGIIGRNDSAKGIKAAISVKITGGAFRIDSADDAIHSDGAVMITGGSFTLLTGDDTIRGGGSVEVNGGNINVLNSPGDFGKDSWDSSIIVDIILKGDSIEASFSHPVYISGNKAMIRSAGTYKITGVLNDGQIIVNTKDKGQVKLILSGAHISCSNNAPICVLDADEVIIFLDAGTENVMVDGNKYVFASPNADEPNAAVFSRSNMTIMGEGTLRVTGNFNDGVASKDGLTIMSGVVFVNSVDDGIRGKDYLIVKGGRLTLNVSGDGLKSDNSINAALGFVSIENGTIDIVSGGDAIQAETSVLIYGGNFSLRCGGGSEGIKNESKSAKGIKGAVSVIINNGVFVIDSADDAVHSDGTITVNNGALTILTGDDGIHADRSITINNGKIDILKSFEGIEAPVITINNGEIHVVSSDDGINLGVDSGVIPAPGQPGTRFSLYSGDYYLYINGGYIFVNALGDGIDSNGAVLMNGGVLIVDGPSSDMNSALDHVAFNITKGYLIAVGSSGMALPLGELSDQYSVMLNFQMPNQAGTLISVRTSNGTELFTFKPTKRYQSIIFSMPNLTPGSTYDVYVGGSHTGTIKDGLYLGGTYIPGTRYISFKITNKVTQIGPSGWFFFPPR
ncbi:MAG: carbohydrate-binding domain-containing protein, partial [Candidatus Bathyarchaeia archaeon]